ncbi:MAG TPA: transcriptional regulator NanR [Rhizobiaceae bacterium]|nr:transcriptional regulator NanR [Rhizobiaceae bacterium]
MNLDPFGSAGSDEDRIVRRKLSDQVLERLRGMIARGDLAPGAPMPSERDLMKRFGVGRPAVREAMQQLHTMGLISISHGERARVSELSAEIVFRQIDMMARMILSASPDNLEHLKKARRFFELGMVAEAARNAVEADVAALRQLVLAQKGELGDPAAFIRADIAFHRRIASISKNPIFVAVSDAMLSWLFNYHTDLLIWSGQEKVTLLEHEEIVGFIAAHDAAGAEQAMAKHLDRSAMLYQHRQ